MAQQVWAWFIDPSNRQLLGMIGSLTAALVCAGWALYTWFKRDGPGNRKQTFGDYSPIIQAHGPISYNVSTKTVKAFSVGDDRFLPSRYWEHFRWSFSRDKYVHPKIVEEFIGMLSDSGNVVVAIDIEHGHASDRFSSNFQAIDLNDQEWVHYEVDCGDIRPEFFRYRYVGTSRSGVHILHCLQGTGGTGIFGYVLLLALQGDTILVETEDDMKVEDRVILKSIGMIGLGDRYSGEIYYQDGVLSIGPDVGIMPYKNREHAISVHID